jgi:hypothetical protein
MALFWYKKEFLIYLGVTTFLVSIYFAPLIKLNTSGFFAYGGGDHTSYFGVSEFLLDHDMQAQNIARLTEYTTTRSRAGYEKKDLRK